MMNFRSVLSLATMFCLLFPTSAYGDCDFKTGITLGPNKTFIYIEACHQKVGQLVQDNANKTTQITDLTKAITLKDLALKDSDKRASDWMDTSGKLEDRLQKVDSLQKHNEVLYFIGGVLVTCAAAYAAAKLVGK